jgi:hypothetical protein
LFPEPRHETGAVNRAAEFNCCRAKEAWRILPGESLGKDIKAHGHQNFDIH